MIADAVLVVCIGAVICVILNWALTDNIDPWKYDNDDEI